MGKELPEDYIKAIQSGGRSFHPIILNAIHIAKKTLWKKINRAYHHKIDDFLQDAFYEFWKTLIAGKLKYKNAKSISAFICEIAYRIFLNEKMKEEREKNSFTTFREITLDDITEYRDILKKNLRFLVDKKLSDSCSRLITLFIEGYKPDVICNKLQIANVDMVYRKKYKCLEQIRNHIKKNGLQDI